MIIDDAIAAPLCSLPSPSRYVVYLDGVGQSGEAYTPDIVDFLNAFTPALPDDMELVQGLMMYFVLNQPLDQDRPLAFVWRLADKMRWSNPAAILGLKTTKALQANPDLLRSLMANPEQAQRLRVLHQLGQDLQQKLQPWGGLRSDWAKNEFNLGSTMEDNLLQNLQTGMGSVRTILPRLASDTVVRVFLKQGASVWVLRTSQIGGRDPNIAPIAPMTL